MSISDRIAGGSITKGSSVTNKGLDTVSGSLDAFRQGVNIRGGDDLLNYTSFKIRPNTGFIRTFNGRDLPENVFDDSHSLANVSGQMAVHSSTSTATGTMAQISLGGENRLGERISHRREIRDLGQNEYYIDRFFIDQPNLTGVSIIENHSMVLVVPERIVDASNAFSFDGVIEPLDIRRLADQSSIEIPYVARSVKGSMGGEEDKFKNTAVITDEVELEEIKNPQTVWFLDSVEHMGTVDVPGIQNVNEASIAPFADTVDQEVTVAPLNDDEIKNLLMKANYTDDDAKVHEITATRGFVFHYSDSGYDSIAYGGLKK